MKHTLTVEIAFGLTLGLAALAGATPWFTQDPRTLPEGGWRAEEHVLYSHIDHALSDGKDAPLAGGVTEASALTFHTRVRYGVSDNLTLFADMPYVTKRVHGPGGATQENSGWGDVALLAKYKYAEVKSAGRRRAVAVLYKSDTGHTRGLTGLLATGTGQDSLGLLHLWEWRSAGTTWYANAGYVWADERTDTQRNPGDQLVFNLAGERKQKTGPWSFVGELNGQYEGNATQNGAWLPGTGATLLSVAPGVQHTRKSAHGVTTTWEAGVQLPFLRHGDLPAVPDYTVYAGVYTMF